MDADKLLMIFVKNPEPGKVKTRLAKTIGDHKALEVYHNLLMHTHNVTNEICSDKAVYYSDFVDDGDLWSSFVYQKYIQEGKELGEKMSRAFDHAFSMEYKKVIIIGSDCYELTPEIIESAFDFLDQNDVVIGPASDGGYYLLGMNKMINSLFTGKEWSTENVLLDTLLDLKKEGLSHKLLPTLSDVDYEEDLGDLKKIIDD